MKNSFKVYFPFLLSIILISFMIGLSEAFNQKELIFPEIGAISIGCLIAPIQPWKVSKMSKKKTKSKNYPHLWLYKMYQPRIKCCSGNIKNISSEQ